MNYSATRAPALALLWLMALLILTSCEVVEAPLVQPTTGVKASPTPVLPSPTPVPSAPALLARALEQRAVGDDDSAAAELTVLLDAHPQSPEARPARYYLAESFARRGRWTSAVETLRVFVAEPVDDALTAPALFWLARGYEAAGDWPNAIATYERYRGLQTVLEPYAAFRQAAQHEALGQLAEAARGYEAGAMADIDRGIRAAAFERAIAARRALGQPDEALRLYGALLDYARQPDYRARMLAEAAALAQELGQGERARAWLVEIVATAPATAPAIAAVDQLVAAGAPELRPADAGRIYFAAGRYDAALAQLTAALAAVPGGDEALELQRLRALALRGLGRFSEALDALAAVGAASPNGEPGRQAQLDWVQTLGQSGETRQAIDAYRQFADAYPDDLRAPEALDRAAQLIERLGDAEGALQARLELGRRYPASHQAATALHRAGLSLFAAGRFVEAQTAWQQLAGSRQGYEEARGAFWAGRAARAQGLSDQANRLFETARQADPVSYYAARAADELGVTISGTLALNTPLTEDDWRAVEEWVTGWSGQPASPADGQGYDLAVIGSGPVQRATELARVGLYDEARAEWRGALQAWAEDPAGLLQLARIAYERKVTPFALAAAEQLAALAPEGSAAPPIPLRRLLFPAPYPDLVIAAAREQGIDPRLFYALMRQESRFDPTIASVAGARGLAQVMPDTGQGIAGNLGFEGYTPDDLYRPSVSIRFGAYYIGQRIKDMGGSLQGGLAAYNAGLGNALRWAGGSRVADADLFAELIDYPETNNYVKLVYGYYYAYRQLYDLPSQ